MVRIRDGAPWVGWVCSSHCSSRPAALLHSVLLHQGHIADGHGGESLQLQPKHGSEAVRQLTSVAAAHAGHACFCRQDYRRRYNLEPLVKSSIDEELQKGRQRATVRAWGGHRD